MIAGIALVISFIIPRFVLVDEGFAGAATATMVFGLLLLLVTIITIYLFVKTLGVFKSISIPARICGIAPAVIMIIGLISLWMFLTY